MTRHLWPALIVVATSCQGDSGPATTDDEAEPPAALSHAGDDCFEGEIRLGIVLEPPTAEGALCSSEEEEGTGPRFGQKFDLILPPGTRELHVHATGRKPDPAEIRADSGQKWLRSHYAVIGFMIRELNGSRSSVTFPLDDPEEDFVMKFEVIAATRDAEMPKGRIPVQISWIPNFGEDSMQATIAID